MSFGKTLAALREAAGLTQTELAQRAGVSIDTLRGWEQKRHLPRIDDAYRLAKALDVRLDQLIVGSDMVPDEPPAAEGKGKKGKKGGK